MLFKIAFDNYSSLSVATFKDGTNTFTVYNRNEALNCQMQTKQVCVTEEISTLLDGVKKSESLGLE